MFKSVDVSVIGEVDTQGDSIHVRMDREMAEDRYRIVLKKSMCVFQI